MLNTAVKRGRGRPRKTESTKFTAKKTVGGRPKKRGRGRPIGSKNKIKANEIGVRIERLESVVALLAEILGGIMSKMSSKKAK